MVTDFDRDGDDAVMFAAVFVPHGEMLSGVALSEAYRVDLVSSEADLIDSRVIEDEELASIYPKPLASYR